MRAERTASDLKYLLKHDCGSCHGMKLKGGLGSPLTKELMHNRSRNEIKGVIFNGRPGTAMPPWRSLVTEGEANRLAEILIKGDDQ
ncbi:MAG: cytochrome c [Bdellovibrionales bacterium]|nr:cytochrome c [Bdellovibrionales bacterium]